MRLLFERFRDDESGEGPGRIHAVDSFGAAGMGVFVCEHRNSVCGIRGSAGNPLVIVPAEASQHRGVRVKMPPSPSCWAAKGFKRKV